jgi:hypothetical protein
MPVMQSFISFSSTQLVPLLQDAVKWFTELSPWMQKVVIGLGGLALAAGPAILALGGLMSTVSSLVSVYATYQGSSIAATIATQGMTGALTAKAAAAWAAAKATAAAFAPYIGAAALIGAVGVAVYKLTSYWVENTEAGQATVEMVSDLITGFNELLGQPDKLTLQMDRTTQAVKDHAEWFGRMRAEQQGINYDEMIAANAELAASMKDAVAPAMEEVAESAEEMDSRLKKSLEEAAEAKIIDKAKKALGMLKTDELSLEEATRALELAGIEVDKTTKKMSEAEKEAKKHAENMAKIRNEWMGLSDQTAADDLAEALAGLGDSIPTEQLEGLGQKIEGLIKKGVTLDPVLKGIYQRFNMMKAATTELDFSDVDFGIAEGVEDSLANIGEVMGDEYWADLAQSAAAAGIPIQEIGEHLKSAGASAHQTAMAMKPLDDEARAAEEATAKFNAQLQAVTEGLLIIGDMFGGIGGDLAGMLSTSIQGFTQMNSRINEMNEAVASGDMTQAAADAEKFQMQVGLAANAAGMLGGVLSGSANPSLQKFGAALQGAAAGAKLGSAFGPVGTAIGAVGGAIFGFIGKAKKMREEMKKLKKEFVESHGGMEKLSAEAKAAGVDLDKAFNAKTPEKMKEEIEKVNEQLDAFNELLDVAGGSVEDLEALAAQAGVSLDAIWDAKNPEEYLSAVEQVKKELDDWNNAQDELQTAMDKYGITIDQLGGKFRQQKFDEMGMDLLKSFELLKAAGVDVGVITEKMSEDMSDYVNRSIAAGTTIPEAMRPMIQQMIDQGQLLDENGNAITSMEDAGIQFAETMEQGIANAVDAINKLVAVLAQGFKIPVDVFDPNAGNNPNVPAGGGGGGGGGGSPTPGNPGGYPEYAEGTRGFKDFGAGTPVMLHGVEAVVRPGDLSTVVNLSINENPMQTAETVEQMRKFTVDTVEEEVARSLADAIEAGQA